MAKRSGNKPKQQAPAAFIAAGTAILRRIAANRHLVAQCGATAKHSGQPCRQFAMANGRCYYHGGRTPKGKDWHRRQWPDKTAPDAIAKMENKLQMQERAWKARQKRLAKMTPEEQAAHSKWHKERPLGTPEHRERKRLERKQNAEARARFARHKEQAEDAGAATARPVAPQTAEGQEPGSFDIFG